MALYYVSSINSTSNVTRTVSLYKGSSVLNLYKGETLIAGTYTSSTSSLTQQSSSKTTSTLTRQSSSKTTSTLTRQSSSKTTSTETNLTRSSQYNTTTGTNYVTTTGTNSVTTTNTNHATTTQTNSATTTSVNTTRVSTYTDASTLRISEMSFNGYATESAFGQSFLMTYSNITQSATTIISRLKSVRLMQTETHYFSSLGKSTTTAIDRARSLGFEFNNAVEGTQCFFSVHNQFINLQSVPVNASSTANPYPAEEINGTFYFGNKTGYAMFESLNMIGISYSDIPVRSAPGGIATAIAGNNILVSVTNEKTNAFKSTVLLNLGWYYKALTAFAMPYFRYSSNANGTVSAANTGSSKRVITFTSSRMPYIGKTSGNYYSDVAGSSYGQYIALANTYERTTSRQSNTTTNANTTLTSRNTTITSTNTTLTSRSTTITSTNTTASRQSGYTSSTGTTLSTASASAQTTLSTASASAQTTLSTASASSSIQTVLWK